MIGKLRNRITFQTKSAASDGAGGFVNTPSTYYTCWAEIITDTNNRSNLAGKDNIADSILFRIRYTTSKTFDNKLVISYKNNTYNISSIINERDENNYYLITCSTLK